MARRPRNAPGGLVYHVLNRSVGKMEMFRRDADFEAFERIMLQAHDLYPIRILCYCVMPTHWHFVVWPEEDGQVTDFFRWLTHTHAMRWRVSHHTVGYGHLYQGRFKSFPVARDEHLLTLCRYVERNPLSANLVKHAEQWRWSSLWLRLQGSHGSAGASAAQRAILSDWPVDRPSDWTDRVNRPVTSKELEGIETSLKRGSPLGSVDWAQKIAARLDLGHTLRREGRPKKTKQAKNDSDKN